VLIHIVQAFQSTLPLRGATATVAASKPQFRVSIHAPLTGSDGFPPLGCPDLPRFNPRSPYGERRRPRAFLMLTACFNPRSPYGERLSVICKRDNDKWFQSTLPLRGATHGEIHSTLKIGVSIHAPLTGSDCVNVTSQLLDMSFNPRSPYGERHRLRLAAVRSPVFQSTLPLRGATPYNHDYTTNLRGFNPRSPYGERHANGALTRSDLCVSIHAPLTGSDRLPPWRSPAWTCFNPRSPYGERRGTWAACR